LRVTADAVFASLPAIKHTTTLPFADAVMRVRLVALVLLIFAQSCDRRPPSEDRARPPASAAPAPEPAKSLPHDDSGGDKPAAEPQAPAAGAQPSAPRPAPSFAYAKSATAEFVSAVLARDPARVLACFSRARPWTLTSIQGHKPSPSRYSYAKLEAGLKQGGEFRDVIFGEAPDDNLHHELEVTGEAAWVAKTATTFTPPGEPRDVFVTWRREGDRFVISDIAFPF
jgi:hypothetical protein